MRTPPPERRPQFGTSPTLFRLPPGTRCGRVRLQVSDLSRSIDYYASVIGLRPSTLGERSAALHAADDVLPLVELYEKPGISPVPRRGAYGLYHFAILLPTRADLGRFVAHLGDLSVRAGSADHHVSEALYLHDPDGLGIEVYADRPASTWPVRDGELVMAADPLNVAELVRAGGGQRWTHAPSGTRVGHVHLHVGDLGLSERFYHLALGLDKTMWSYPSALFLAADGYHHHLGTNTWSPGPSARDDQARLLEWELVIPSGAAPLAAQRIRDAGWAAEPTSDGWLTADPWGTRLRLVGHETPTAPTP
ncbi:MAG: VOC family protein [Vicinamibacterales bacterium]